MKKIYTLTLLFALIYNLSISQNTFPATGNMGIGTANPQDKVHVLMNSATNGTGVSIAAVNTGGAGSQPSVAYLNPSGSKRWAAGIDVGADYYQLVDASGNIRFSVNQSGNVGIGTSTPNAKLELGSGNLAIQDNSQIRLRGGLNGETGISFIAPSDELRISHRRDSYDRYISLGSYDAASVWSSQLSMNTRTGNVGIGTKTPGSYKLAVAGKIAATGEVRVFTDGTTSFPDYVFEPSYKLPLLEETEAFIKENHHLPEVPSAAEIAKEGMSLNEMNEILLKKVEELTLYMIELKKENTEMKKESQEMKKEIEVLKKSHQK